MANKQKDKTEFKTIIEVLSNTDDNTPVEDIMGMKVLLRDCIPKNEVWMIGRVYNGCLFEYKAVHIGNIISNKEINKDICKYCGK